MRTFLIQGLFFYNAHTFVLDSIKVTLFWLFLPRWAMWPMGLLFMILSKVEVFLNLSVIILYYMYGLLFYRNLILQWIIEACPGYTSVWYLWECYFTQLLRFLSCQPVQALHRRTHLRWISKPCNSPVWRTKINLDLSEMSNTFTKKLRFAL